MARVQGERLLLAEIPLLYETGAEQQFNQIIVTACSSNSQRQRLLSERRLSEALAEKLIDAQLALGDKVRRADRVVWTDCSLSITERQVERLAREVLLSYG
jgi:dephospho-CoA kinase